MPEIAKTLTVGGVLSPRFLPGFSLAVDYYQIKVDGLIGSLTAQQIINLYADHGTHEQFHAEFKTDLA